MQYAELIGDLFPRLTGGIRWGLERTERILAAIGDPQQRYRSIHIGGTNGKGSVAATLAAILSRTGERVGLYTSPHLCTFRERIQVDGLPVSEARVLEAAEVVWPQIEREGASFFEATTALAFQIFAAEGVEIAIVEVGLGGRLDSTNLIDPALVVLTNIAVDHTDHLGSTLESIAVEKAGIIKPGVPVITGESRPEVVDILRRRASEVAAPFRVLDPDLLSGIMVSEMGTSFQLKTERWGDLLLRTPLLGEHQAWNTALAIAALEMPGIGPGPSREEVEEGLAGIRWPGRVQWERVRGVDWIFDVAHNPAGVEALRHTLESLPISRPITAIVGILGDKDWGRMLDILSGFVDRLILTSPSSAPPDRLWDPQRVVEYLPPGLGVVLSDLESALIVAEEAVQASGDGTVLVTGSFHTVGDSLALMGLAPDGTDPALPSPTVYL